MKIQNSFGNMVLVCTVLMVLATATTANAGSITFTYTGGDFNSFTGTTPLTTADFITGSFTFTSPLPSGLTSFDESAAVLDWTVSDQVDTLSQSAKNFLAELLVSTDSFGDITTANFLVETEAATTTGFVLGSIPGGEDFSIKAVQSVAVWQVEENPSTGKWAVTAQSTAPEASSAMLLSFGLAFLVLARRMFSRSAS